MYSIGNIAQLGEHSLDVRRVAGSSPVVSITRTLACWGSFFYGEKKVCVSIISVAVDDFSCHARLF